jgi:hypothetical protein
MILSDAVVEILIVLDDAGSLFAGHGLGKRGDHAALFIMPVGLPCTWRKTHALFS